MKISLYVDFSDITSAKETLLDRLNRFVLPDEKHRMYKLQSVDQILQSLKKAGIDGLELLVPRELTDKNIMEIKNLAKKQGLSINNIHQSGNNIYNIPLLEIQRLCKIANIFLSKVVTLHSDTLGKKMFDKIFISELKKLQQKYRIKFGIENMPKSPFSLTKTYSYNADEFSETINNAELFITLDTTHLAQTGADICNFYKNNKEKIVNIHLSDYKKDWRNKTLLLANGTHLPLGNGELPIPNFLKILKEKKYDGNITMEINADLDGLCRSAKMIRDVFK